MYKYAQVNQIYEYSLAGSDVCKGAMQKSRQSVKNIERSFSKACSPLCRVQTMDMLYALSASSENLQ